VGYGSAGKGADQDRGIAYMSAVGGAGAGVEAEEGDDRTITIRRGVGGWDGCGYGCGCNYEFLREKLIL